MDQLKAGKMNLSTSPHCQFIQFSFSLYLLLNVSNYRWYNTPPPPSKKQKKSQLSPPTVFAGPSLTASVEETTVNGVNAGSETTPESDSKPIDFNTFIPTYDATLSVGGASGSDLPAHAAAATALSAQPAQTVSQEEAFKRALEATYWSGYWTAVYHVRF